MACRPCLYRHVVAYGSGLLPLAWCREPSKQPLLPAGYTPLHMAVGYSRIPSVQVLIDAGADPEKPDKKGRTVIALVEDLRKAMPLTAELMGRRSMLEQVMGVLTGGHHGGWSWHVGIQVVDLALACQ